MTKIVILDSLFASLDVEEQAAREVGATIERWDGDPRSLSNAEAVAHVRTRVDGSLIAAMPRCRVISRFGSGIDTVDLEAAQSAGIEVVTVRDYGTTEVATQTLALAFALVRRLAMTAGHLDSSWDAVAAETPLRRCRNATVVGIGTIGRSVAAALAPLGYDVLAVTRHAPDDARRVGARVVELADGLASADIVFLHAALDETTRELIDARRLAVMRPGAILVNTARLGLMDTDAVAAALDEGTLGGLALDAVLPAGSPLRRFAGDPRVLVTPHVGWYSEESAETLRRETIASALAALGRSTQAGVRA